MVHEEYERDITEFYEINNGAILGEGISGSVRMCTHRETGIEYALKTLDKSKLKADALNNLRQEIRIMAQVDHPHIIRLHECFEDKKCIRLVLELCTGGELLDRLHAQSGHHYTERVACGYVQTMLSAIRYLHEHNIVHRDLKLENFLFESTDDDSQMKLIDFGLSQFFEENEIIVSPVGTPYYVAPEVLSGAYTNKCDVWSIGVIAFMLLSGTPPFYGKDDLGTLRSVRAGRLVFEDKYFKNISMTAKNFISSCLTKNVEKRPDARTLLGHDWFRMLQVDMPSPSLNVCARLVSFEKRTALTKLCMEVVAHTLSSEQINNLRTQFKMLDTDNTGEVSYTDLMHVLKRQGKVSTANMEQIFGSTSFSDSTKLKYHQFLAATLSRQAITENNMRVAFEKLSKHHECITFEDIKDLLGKEATDEEIRNMMREVNVDPDNSTISYDNFKTIMHGGDQSPMINTPYNKYRKQISFGSPSSGGSRKMSAPRSGRSTPLARKAITNRAMSLSSPTEEDVPSAESSSSPMRPETLVFEDDASSQCASPLVKMPEQENDDYIPPPPSSHPPSP
eukprot:CAMPEP_0185020290 /NCGR_PEP_ID=MMETSP1103-20130426/2889_1 /TAXON_ID=36769 /ORGANISM="Paraphysomonas bandaiensis, Strain Caron Lab Isolate" /LENGTH=564 /DNA_ID=CAMNT_0027551099 /DNA_START=338 /DNA_END=2032 /DNA_ORIENTATION=-